MAKDARPFVGLIAGVAAGLVASAAMAAFQGRTGTLIDDDPDDDPATLAAADAARIAVVGDPVPAAQRDLAGPLVHYVVGAVVGGVYGVLTEYRPDASAGFGSAYGVATQMLLDEAIVPATGLGPEPDDVPLTVHGRSVAAHILFGAVLEGVRTLIAGRRAGELPPERPAPRRQ